MARKNACYGGEKRYNNEFDFIGKIVRRRSRRVRMWNISLLFLIYYCVAIYAAKNEGDGASLDGAMQVGGWRSDNGSLTDQLKKSIEMTSPETSTTEMIDYLPERTTVGDICSPPAIEQFPRPLMTKSQRYYGGLVLHILVAIFTFFGLVIVCDEYFVPSLDRLCEKMKLSPDVVGATFMAAGNSAPRLATVVMGVFFAKDDIVVSGVIGSAVFKIMYVISVCALCSGAVCQLDWWPLVRDCFFYCMSIIVVLIIIYNEVISPFESVVLLLCYVCYCITLHFNTVLKRWVMSLKIIPEGSHGARGAFGQPTGQTVTQPGQGQENMFHNPDQPDAVIVQTSTAAVGEPERSMRKSTPESLLWSAKCGALAYPIHFLCKITMPDCRMEKYRNWYPFTFIVSMVWISFYSYSMVWMITVIGSTLGIPDAVMGLTFVAAGFSVPGTISSIATIKKGFGDMVVSNAIGSNVFDILVCLGLPWFIQTAIIMPGSQTYVISKGLVYTTLSLFSTVVVLIMSTHLNGWKLDKRLGIILMVWYLIFITVAAWYELNVFGYWNPPECISMY